MANKWHRSSELHGRAHLALTGVADLLKGRLRKPVVCWQMTDDALTLFTHFILYAPRYARIEIVEPIDSDPGLTLYLRGERYYDGLFTKEALETIAGQIRKECV